MAAAVLGWLVAQGQLGLATAVPGLGASVIIYLIMEELLREARDTDAGPGRGRHLVRLLRAVLPRWDRRQLTHCARTIGMANLGIICTCPRRLLHSGLMY
jgi:hypothetical protein